MSVHEAHICYWICSWKAVVPKRFLENESWVRSPLWVNHRIQKMSALTCGFQRMAAYHWRKVRKLKYAGQQSIITACQQFQELQVHTVDQTVLPPLWSSFIGTGIHNGPVPPALKLENKAVYKFRKSLRNRGWPHTHTHTHAQIYTYIIHTHIYIYTSAYSHIYQH